MRRSQDALIMWTHLLVRPRPSVRLAHTAGAMGAGNIQRGYEKHDVEGYVVYPVLCQLGWLISKHEHSRCTFQE